MTDVPWGEDRFWKTKSAWLSWIRGGIRRSLWNRHPCKLEFIKKHRIKIPNPAPRAKVKEVWGGQCAISGEILPLKMLEVDHKVGNHSLRDVSDIQKFVEGICMVTEDDLQFVSKEMHRIKSYAEKMNISFDEAYAIKKAISICKDKQDKGFLAEHGVVPASNAKERRKQVEEVLKKEKHVI